MNPTMNKVTIMVYRPLVCGTLTFNNLLVTSGLSIGHGKCNGKSSFLARIQRAQKSRGRQKAIVAVDGYLDKVCRERNQTLRDRERQHELERRHKALNEMSGEVSK